MMTWGVSDFVDEKGESDGKYSLSLNFPNADYESAATTSFLEKLKAFENQILDDAVKNSEAWFGEEMSREVAKHTFFPFLKYSKDKLTKKIDPTKPPSIRAKVPNYGGQWKVEIYDPQGNALFPCENQNMTPIDFIPKKSNVAAVIQCGGLWFGGKGWGLTWKLIQCVVQPQEVVSVYGRCHIQLSGDEMKAISQAPVAVAEDEEEVEAAAPVSVPVNTEVEDSDEEKEVVEAEVEPVAKPVKKVVKKAAEPEAEASEVEVPKKKVVKKKA
jgi:hypothetical protein